jgi:DEAD/DEAH box helicase domain-containing protein
MQEILIPSALSGHVKENVISYLKTTFNIKNATFTKAFESHIRSDAGLFRGPFLDIKLPFKSSSDPLVDVMDLKPQFPPFEHQVLAFKRITTKGKAPQNTLVVTGTGSGKTECFLMPVLDHAARSNAKSGIKAIILYPMNALAYDQAGRLAELIHGYNELRGKVTAGIFVGEDDSEEARTTVKSMHPNKIIDDHKALKDNPPDILLTNYKMLDNLLMKPENARLWDGATGDDSSLQFLILDEMHTYDGAQGSDVALLIRRLKAKLGVKKITSIGTSATLSSDTDGTKILQTFAERLFGEKFEIEAIIRESRKSVDEVFVHKITTNKIPDVSEDFFDKCHDISKYVSAQSKLWFGEELESKALGQKILTHGLMRAIFDSLEGKPLPIDDLLNRLGERGITITLAQLNSFLALVTHSTQELEVNGKKVQVPLFFSRVQLWIREMRRLLSNVDTKEPKFKWFDEIKKDNKGHYIPPVYCEECGELGFVTLVKNDAFIWEVPQIYEKYAEASQHIRYLFPWKDREMEFGDVVNKSKLKLCSECGTYEYDSPGSIMHPNCPTCNHHWSYFENWHKITKETKRDKRQCPSCESNNSLRLLGSRVTTLSSIVNSQIFLSKLNPQYSKRLLVFSDSVQDASHRAGYFNARTYRFNLRTAIQSYLNTIKEDVQIEAVVKPFWDYWVGKLGEDKVVATFTPSDLRLMPEYEQYMAGKSRDYVKVLIDRIQWEFYLEYSLRSQVGRTLEKTNSSASYIAFDTIKPHLKSVFETLQENHIHLRDAGLEAFERYFIGIMERSLTRGAVGFEFFKKYREKESAWELDKKTHPWISRLPKGSLDGSEVGALPKFISTNPQGVIFDFAGAVEQGDSWFSFWFKKNFGRITDRTEIVKINEEIFNHLTDKGILNSIKGKNHFKNYGFNPKHLYVTRSIVSLVCDECAHKIVIPANETDHYLNLGCVITHCQGKYSEINKKPQKYYQDIYSSGDVERIFASEHTGLLSRKRREEIEVEFKEKDSTKRRPDAINLLSCTPTLEMGIDIGDLSATVVGSLPPTASNYQQQIGRAGRKTGSALVVSIAQTRPRDLLYFRFPEELIAGNIQPPGCFLDAPDILKRQFFAFILDQNYSTLFRGINKPKVSWLSEEVRQQNDDGFLKRLQNLLNSSGKQLLKNFRSEFEAKDVGDDTWRELQDEFISISSGEIPFLNKIKLVVEKFDHDKSNLDRLKAELREKLAEFERKEEAGVTFGDEEKEAFYDLKREAASLSNQSELIGVRSGFFEFLTHHGFLPNYAFQEHNVELAAMIFDRSKDGKNDKPSIRFKETFDRPAKMGLRELAPFNTFYGGGFKLQINQIDVGNNTRTLIEDWRACRACGHMVRVAANDTASGCPKCGDAMWPDNGSKTKMLKFQKAIAIAESYNAQISDDTDDRHRQFFKVRSYFDIPNTARREAWAYNKSSDFVFGLEFLDTVVLREINFGSEELVKAEKIPVAGEELPAGFHICTSCGRVARPDAKKGWDIKHTANCRYAKDTMSPDKKTKLPDEKPVLLYRELKSEGIRLLLPVSEAEAEVRIASIKAAIMLGFIKKFGGRPMHLEIGEQRFVESAEDESSKRFLVLFDSVPGGTGFLRELWNKDSFFEVVSKALDVLKACGCQTSPDLDGCPRCILAGASQYDYPNISRKEAIRYLEQIIKHKDGMEIAPNGLESVDVSSFLDSELEYKFLSIIRNLKSQQNTKLLDKLGITVEALNVMPNLQDGIELTLKKGDKTVSYKMTWQKRLNSGELQTVVDFYFKPLNSSAQAIALYLDGFKYHASYSSGNRLEQDFMKREALINGEDVENHRVWCLSWKDIELFLNESNDYTKTYLGQEALSGSNYLSQNSFALFFDFLFLNIDHESDKVFKEVVKYNGKQNLINIKPSLISDLFEMSISKGMVERASSILGNSQEPSKKMAWINSSDKYATALVINPEERKVTSYFCFESLLIDRESNEDFIHIWNSLLRTFNLYQAMCSEVTFRVWAEKK